MSPKKATEQTEAGKLHRYLQYFGMLAVFRLEDTMKQFSPQLWLKAAEVMCLIWQHQSFGTGVCADELTAAAAGRRAQSPFQGAPLPLRGIPTDGAGVLRTEADTALLASTKLHEFAPWRASLQLLTMSTSVKHRFFFIPLKTFMFIFFFPNLHTAPMVTNYHSFTIFWWRSRILFPQ